MITNNHTEIDRLLISDPWLAYSRLRESQPIFWSEATRAWIVSRHADVTVQLLNPALANNRRTIASMAARPLTYQRLFDFISEWPAFTDGERHTQALALFRSMFSTAWGAELSMLLAECCREADRSLVAQSSADLVDVIDGIVFTYFQRIFGLPNPQIQQLLSGFFAVEAFLVQSTPAEHDLYKWVSAVEQMQLALRELVDDYKTVAQGSVFGKFLAVARQGQADLRLITSVFVNTFLAGYIPLKSGATDAVVLLLRNDALRREFESLGEKDRHCVAELLRVAPPFRFVGRRAVSTLRIHGQEIEPNTKVYLGIASANRDPVVFERPEEINFYRHKSERDQILTFGAGEHSCVGKGYALSAISLIVTNLLAGGISEWRLDTAKLEWEKAITTSKLLTAPLRRTADPDDHAKSGAAIASGPS